MRDVADVGVSSDGGELLVSTVTKSGDVVTRVPSVSLAVAKRVGSNAVLVAEAVLHRVETIGSHVDP